MQNATVVYDRRIKQLDDRFITMSQAILTA